MNWPKGFRTASWTSYFSCPNFCGIRSNSFFANLANEDVLEQSLVCFFELSHEMLKNKKFKKVLKSPYFVYDINSLPKEKVIEFGWDGRIKPGEIKKVVNPKFKEIIRISRRQDVDLIDGYLKPKQIKILGKVAIEINLQRIKKNPVVWIRRYKEMVFWAIKYKIPIVIASEAKNFEELKGPYELISLGVILGMNHGRAKKALEWIKNVKKNKV